MKLKPMNRAFLICGAFSACVTSGVSHAALEEVIVTAQKREQSINDVGMTISAASGDQLMAQGVTDTSDLAKIVPGFNATESFTMPVYTLRGVGLYDYSLASSPSVALYVDQVPLPYPSMAGDANLDVQRVEVLKGPQGTLFGQSSTGGAINYIPNAPTDEFEAGVDVSYERFGRTAISGFASGALTDSLQGRIALNTVQGGDWQVSASRPSDENGAEDKLSGRILLNWDATDSATFGLNVAFNHDKSDIAQSQYSGNRLNIVAAPDARNPAAIVDPALYAAYTTPGSPGYDPSLAAKQELMFSRMAAGEQQTIDYLTTVDPGDDPRKAEWTPGFRTDRNDKFEKIALRGDIGLSDEMTLTFISTYMEQDIEHYVDGDATVAQVLDETITGNIEFFSQEIRIAYDTDNMHAIVGLNYDKTEMFDSIHYDLFYGPLNESLPGLRFSELDALLKQEIDNTAIFANVEYSFSDSLKFNAGIRYTESNREGEQCNFQSPDAADSNVSKTFGNADIVPGFGFYDLQTAFGLDPANHVVVNPGECYVLNDKVAPTDPGYLRPSITPNQEELKEDNVSWRLGLDYALDQGALVYGTISKGYKAGIISGLSPAVTSAYAPAVQEELLAYEIGVKAPIGDSVQLNASTFYYDYTDKQLRARILDPVFGLLEKLLNVPESEIFGVEVEVLAQPSDGLVLSASATYLDSEVTSSFSTTPDGSAIYNQSGYTGDFKGSTLPYTPKLSAVANVQYEFDVTGNVVGFIGGSLTYSDSMNTTFENSVLVADDFEMDSYTTLDLRAGVAATDDRWRLTFFGRNVTDEYIVNTIFTGDSVYRNASKPAIYGMSLSLRM
ncbi:TonB-dependent receptor [Pseudomaricurvus alcaniphilus]|uniref:TonB-dependent receptor n=1 Tax=Pseudomaricurvus alcaniphilus TaxID=1166482 RepID=UPI00140B6A6E|nr:TonB-dependent receptor [Pseudomaricurvus alcaniphilus]NHN36526.1 TonB-dependent receptor [Pseudomaricurvus alcaniphilus]